MKEKYLGETGVATLVDYINNNLDLKVNLSDIAPVATSGSYNDLLDKPTALSSFTNDVGYITSYTDENVKQNEWTTTTGAWGALPILIAKSNASGINDNVLYSQTMWANPTFTNGYVTKMQIILENATASRLILDPSVTNPIKLKILNASHLWEDVENKIITSNGVIDAPSNSNTYLKWTGSSFSWSETTSGTVTSVGLSAPTGFSVSGSPITSSGTLELSFDSGYSLPTTAKQTNWDTAYGWGDHASAGYLTGISVNNTSYSPSHGVVTLPDYPTTLPASDVYDWAKQSTKPSYAWSEIDNKPSEFTPSAHTHGNIQNNGTLDANRDVAIANGDKLVIADASGNNLVSGTTVTFDGSTTNTALTPKGTFERFLQSADNSSTNNNFALFDGTTGQVIKDSGLNLSVTTTTNGNDTIKTYNFS